MGCVNCEELHQGEVIRIDHQGCCVGCGAQVRPRPEPYQPTGLKAFGWGLLGFFGANMIINLLTVGTGALVAGMGGYSDANIGHTVGFVAGMWIAYQFAQARDYQATRTGALVSFYLQLAVFLLAAMATCSEIIG